MKRQSDNITNQQNPLLSKQLTKLQYTSYTSPRAHKEKNILNYLGEINAIIGLIILAMLKAIIAFYENTNVSFILNTFLV